MQNVILETTKGEIKLAVNEDWSPEGVTRFLELVADGFYDGAPWFRVIDGFVAQCGVSPDPELNKKWQGNCFKDDPVVQGNQRGFVAFGKTGEPDSRSTHIFINYRDNSNGLDRQGFSCFAEVVEGMDVADELARVEWSDQYGLSQAGGIDEFKSAYPQADFIKRAYVAE